MRALVLGAGGFLGTNLCAALLARGDAVRGFGRRVAFPRAMAGVAFTTADFGDRTALARAVEGQDVIFHLISGSVPESSNRDPEADLLEGVGGTLHLLEMCRAGAGRVVFVSSGGTVYGVPARVPIAEDAATDPISAYGVSRLAIEKYLALYGHLHGLRSVVLRVANAYGPFQAPGRGQGVVATLLAQALRGGPMEVWGDGLVVRDFVFVADVVAAMLVAADHQAASGVVNIGSGEGRSIASVVADIGRVVGVAVPVVHRPGRPADVPVNVLEVARARRVLGWHPATSWTDGLRRTAAWLRDGQGVHVSIGFPTTLARQTPGL